MDHNQIQEKEIQEKSQPLPDSSDEIRHKRKNERFAVISLIFGGLALLFEPFIGPFVALVFVLILYILGYILGFTEIPLFGRESIFDDSYGIFLSIVAYGIIAFICILSFFFSVSGIVLAWQGRKGSNWYLAIIGLIVNVIVLATVIVFLYCFFTGKIFF